ncbi:hypothetical protein RUM44_011251 [Polyplax serrata]|uniref:U1-type domain-containing protein n=1 Tax=Polyplax serrata TaxID=468196 RepID=A0ABR1AQ55_POLSC
MEDIKLLVQEEGRSARNLVTFNVPVIETQFDGSANKLLRKPPTSPRSQLDLKRDDPMRYCKRSRESSQSGSRVRSASTGRDKKSELHARYWAFLFGNLQRAVDEIYQTCESDESVTECKEVMMVLDNYCREFKNLINWFKIKWDYETTPPPQRPHSLAWEIRKSSPGKIRQKFTDSTSKDVLKSHLFLVSSLHTPYSNDKSITEEKTEELCVGENDQTIPNLDQSNIKKFVTDELGKINSQKKNNPEGHNESNNRNGIVHPTLHILPENKNGECDDKQKEDMKAESCGENDPQTCSANVPTTDESCQTDPEKDVDENGPKYRSSGQQTCPILTGFNIADLEKMEGGTTEKEATKKFSTTSIAPSDSNIVPKTNKDTPSDGKTVVKSVSNTLSGNKTLLPVNPTNAIAGRMIVRSSYSHAATNPSKSINIQPNIKPGSVVRLPNSSNTSLNRQITATVQKPTWGSRAIPGKSVTVPSNSPAMARLTRSKTVAEVHRVKREPLISLRPVRPATSLRKDLKDSKQSVRSDTKSGTSKNLNFKNTNSTNPVSSSVLYEETSGSVEVLTSQTNGNEEDDGWVKVRSKSRFSAATKTGVLETTLSQSATNLKLKGENKGCIRMTHKTRFHQPSSAISLPTLAFSASDSKENIAIKKPAKTKLETKSKPKENGKSIKKQEKNKTEDVASNKRKSNGDKPRKSCGRLLNEKQLNGTTGKDRQSRIEKVENEKNLALSRGGLKDTEKTIAIDQESIDEDENNFDEEIKRNKETEEMLQKEINELEATDIELETGDEETDGETTTGTEEDPDQDKKSNSSIVGDNEKDSGMPKKSPHYHDILGGMSWADHMDTLDELEKLVVQDCSNKGMTRDEQLDTLERLEEFVARHPGRALELHQKLSSPSRRRTVLDTVKKFQARQAKASEKREQLKMEKAQRLRELLRKVDEVKAAKDKLIEDRRQRLEMKLKRAAENRNLHLKEIMRKAHDEEEKLKEIAFINELEAQNKRHDFMTQCQEQEGRLQGIHEERQRKQEEKAAKEAAVEERRKAIEAERQEKLEKMQERQRKRGEQADKKKQEKEKERQELAREKARDRSERLEALHAAQLEAQEELQKKIQQKQEDYARRHEENIEQIRQKALELSILKCSDDVAPKLIPYETQKLCTACNVLIGSEVYLLSHLRGKKHQEAVKTQVNGKDLTKEEIESHNIKIIVNAPSDKIDPRIELDKERIKNFKKKCKKIRMRMISKGEEYLAKISDSEKVDSSRKGKIQKCLRDVEKTMSSQGKGQWNDGAITTLERSMGEINRTLGKQDDRDQLMFKSLNGFSILNSILQLDMDVPQNMTPYLPQKCFVTASTTYLAAVTDSLSNCKYVILSNKIIALLDILLKRLTVKEKLSRKIIARLDEVKHKIHAQEWRAMMPDHVSSTVIYNSKSSFSVDPVASVVMRVIAKILMTCDGDTSQTETSQTQSDDFLQRLQDIIRFYASTQNNLLKD